MYAIKSRTHDRLLQYINGPTIDPKNSHENLKGVLKNNFTILQNNIKIIPIKYVMKCISSQHGNNQGIVNHLEKNIIPIKLH